MTWIWCHSLLSTISSSGQGPCWKAGEDHECPSELMELIYPQCFGPHVDCHTLVNLWVVSNLWITVSINILLFRPHSIFYNNTNFQLKHNWTVDQWKSHKGEIGKGDPPHSSPGTLFLSPEFVEKWWTKVEGIRPYKPRLKPKLKPKPNTTKSTNPNGRKHTTKCTHKAVGPVVLNDNPLNTDGTEEPDVEDVIALGMLIPNSVLNQCHKSYLVANSTHMKASKTLFTDTGVIALLCSYDHLLFAVNMTTPGEQQFYTITLITTLLDKLPLWWRLGVLYDIGCQTHHSLGKWDFIPEWKDHITFGVSIFYAYGHQWSYQLWYHPHKCGI